MTTDTRTFSRHWFSALPLVVLFAIGSTVAKAETRIGTANSVKPEASGSIAGTLSDNDHDELDLEFFAQFLTPAEAAQALGVSTHTVHQQIETLMEGVAPRYRGCDSERR